MKRVKALVAGVVVCGVLAAGGRYGYERLYAAEREVLVARLDRSLANAAYFEDRLADSKKVRSELVGVARTTLGASEEEARHHLRSLLHRIAASEGLQGIVVSDGRAEGVRNPAGPAKVKEPGLSKVLNTGADFQTLSGTVKGTGTLEQVMRALGVARAQPWVHRVEGFTIKPKDETRETFELTMEVATILVRDLVPAEHASPAVVALAPEASQAWRGIVGKNVFKEPPPTVAPKAVATAPQPEKPRPPERPPPPPYGDWELVGVWESGTRVEAWVRNRSSNERRALAPGMGVLGAVLVSAEGERAVFEVEGQKCEVRLQQTLAQRKPTN